MNASTVLFANFHMSSPLDQTASRAIAQERRQATIVRSASTSRRAARFHQGESAISFRPAKVARQAVVDRRGRDGGMTFRDAQLMEVRHDIARRVKAFHAALLTVVDLHAADVGAARPEPAREHGMNLSAKRRIEGVEFELFARLQLDADSAVALPHPRR